MRRATIMACLAGAFLLAVYAVYTSDAPQVVPPAIGVSAQAPPRYRFSHWTTADPNIIIVSPRSAQTDLEILGPATQPVTMVLVGPLGDLNNDGIVDHLDLVAFSAAWHKKEGEAGYEPRADFDGDGIIDHDDMFEFSKLWHVEQ